MKTEIILVIASLISCGFAMDDFRCPENQTLINPGGKWCDPVCNSDDEICVSGAPRECVCKGGYVRLTDDFLAPCVLSDDCEFQLCGSACPKYCGKPDDVACILLCVQGCFCKPPYVLRSYHQFLSSRYLTRERNMKTGMFVIFAVLMIGALASACRPNETTKTRNRCDKVCFIDELLCAPKDSAQKCFCKRGYLRLAYDFAAPCVLPKDCIKCGKNQEYLMCGPACREYCGMPEDEICQGECMKGCFCKEGYVLRSEDSDECILRRDCPQIY
ncbi:Trypsin Inhibitor like cysteine rich domain [Popillia japonica]|uniref:Trypsin Inhibitor like cysteine rich domain n=1 Tax=Popillia japonica TaxID=7064 RepID=A0AAW1HVC4_POPJA